MKCSIKKKKMILQDLDENDNSFQRLDVYRISIERNQMKYKLVKWHLNGKK